LRELTVVLFAGAGGSDEGIKAVTKRHIDIAINHDPVAISMNKRNNPLTKFYIEDVRKVDPIEATQGRPVGLLWMSPDCTFFSKARNKPIDRKGREVRSLAWVGVKWAKLVRPRIIMLENVEEFQDWCPLIKNEKGELTPDSSKKGETFYKFVNSMKKLGYEVQFRELRACDYGAPTTRKRLFMIARCDGEKIVWPEATHGDPEQMEVRLGLLKPWRIAGECIDWSIPCPSIFATSKEIKDEYGITAKRPLAEKTMRRIALGVKKFIIDNPEPYILDDKASFLIQYHSETSKYDVRGQELTKPLMTLDTSPRYALVSAFITKFYKSGIGQSLKEPLHTITTSPGHFGLVQAFLIKYYGDAVGQSLNEPLHTITTKERFGLVMVKGEKYQISDICMRMLQTHEQFKAQGFRESYVFTHDEHGNPISRADQNEKLGNSVSPPVSEALTRANYRERYTEIAI